MATIFKFQPSLVSEPCSGWMKHPKVLLLASNRHLAKPVFSHGQKRFYFYAFFGVQVLFSSKRAYINRQLENTYYIQASLPKTEKRF